MEVSQVVQDIARLAGVEVALETDTARKEVPVRFWSDPNPARRALNLDPPLSLAGGVERYASWIRERLEAERSVMGKS